MAYKEKKNVETNGKARYYAPTPRHHKVVKGEERPAQFKSIRTRDLERSSKALSDLRAAGRANGSEFVKANKDEYKKLREKVQNDKKQLRKANRYVKKELKKK